MCLCAADAQQPATRFSTERCWHLGWESSALQPTTTRRAASWYRRHQTPAPPQSTPAPRGSHQHPMFPNAPNCSTQLYSSSTANTSPQVPRVTERLPMAQRPVSHPSKQPYRAIPQPPPEPSPLRPGSSTNPRRTAGAPLTSAPEHAMRFSGCPRRLFTVPDSPHHSGLRTPQGTGSRPAVPAPRKPAPSPRASGPR